MEFFRKNSTFILIFLLFILIITPYSVRKGMFLDGLTYSSIARNMAEENGTFWEPHYTKTTYNTFYETLPLQFFLQSIFFRVFGDKIWVDRIYGIFMVLLTIFFFMLLLRKIGSFAKTGEKEEYNDIVISWSAFLFIVIPVIMYSSVNNLLENTVTLFAVLSVYTAVKSFSSKHNILFSILSGLCILAAFLSKSVVGLFPLIVYPTIGIVFKKKRWLKHWIFQVGIFIIVLGFILVFIKGGRNCIFSHFQKQIFPSIEGTREIYNSRLGFFLLFLQEFSVPLIVALLLSRFKKWHVGKIPIFFLIIGLSGLIPLAISQKLARRYFVPSLPFFAGALGYSTYWAVQKTVKLPVFKIIYKYLHLIIIIAIIFLGIVSMGKIHKNKTQWGEVLPNWKELKIYDRNILVKPCGFKPSWGDIAFFQRHFKWSFGNGKYLLQKKVKPCPVDPKEYRSLINGPKLRFWEKK